MEHVAIMMNAGVDGDDDKQVCRKKAVEGELCRQTLSVFKENDFT